MKEYSLERKDFLLFTRCAIKRKNRIISMKFLVDTGSSYTILPYDVLESIGYAPSYSKNKVRIITGSGIIIAPQLTVECFIALGNEITNFRIVAHTLPSGTYAKGILGMDFLTKIKAIIDIERGIIQLK